MTNFCHTWPDRVSIFICHTWLDRVSIFICHTRPDRVTIFICHTRPDRVSIFICYTRPDRVSISAEGLNRLGHTTPHHITSHHGVAGDFDAFEIAQRGAFGAANVGGLWAAGGESAACKSLTWLSGSRLLVDESHPDVFSGVWLGVCRKTR